MSGAVLVPEPAIREQTPGAAVTAASDGPLHRIQQVVFGFSHPGQPADVKTAAARVLSGRKPGVFVENLRGGLKRERSTEAHALGDFADDPPVGSCLCRTRQERTLP